MLLRLWFWCKEVFGDCDFNGFCFKISGFWRISWKMIFSVILDFEVGSAVTI
jgi:hypothetical protein